MKKIGLILLVFAFLVSCASTAQSPVSSPNVGNYAPDFSIVDVSGNEVRLSDFNGKKKVVLIFYSLYQTSISTIRNDDVDLLKDVQRRIDRIKKLNAEVIAISSMGDQQDVVRMKNALGITFTLIPKPNRKVAEDFGVWNKSGNYATAIIILDKKGRIRYKGIYAHDLPYHGTRISISEIIRQLQGLQ
jgi:peroxiredoxin